MRGGTGGRTQRVLANEENDRRRAYANAWERRHNAEQGSALAFVPPVAAKATLVIAAFLETEVAVTIYSTSSDGDSILTAVRMLPHPSLAQVRSNGALRRSLFNEPLWLSTGTPDVCFIRLKAALNKKKHGEWVDFARRQTKAQARLEEEGIKLIVMLYHVGIIIIHHEQIDGLSTFKRATEYHATAQQDSLSYSKTGLVILLDEGDHYSRIKNKSDADRVAFANWYQTSMSGRVTVHQNLARP